MKLIDDEALDAFFEPYSRNVDHFYEASYWRLCDEIIKEIARREIGVMGARRLLDAGGGTGRWALWCLDEIAEHVTVADRSAAMLRQAAANTSGAGSRNVELIHCDIEDALALEDDSFDAVISIYNMLSFLESPADGIRTLYRVLRPGGVALIMAQSFANALASKSNGELPGSQELGDLARTQVVHWAPHVPPLRVFTSADLVGLTTAAGFRVRRVYGVTCLLSPGPEDFTYPYERMSTVSLALNDSGFFQSALELELAYNGRDGWAERGVNLMIAVQRP